MGELFFIMTSLWMDQYYYVFGFTLLVFFILLITCAEVTVLLVYYQLCRENHRWWWFSFFTGGSVSFYVFAYSCVWFKSLEAKNFDDIPPLFWIHDNFDFSNLPGNRFGWCIDFIVVCKKDFFHNVTVESHQFQTHEKRHHVNEMMKG